MNKNNKSLDKSKSLSPKNKTNNEEQGHSQFVRGKLEHDYRPKMKVFKHKLLRTQDEQQKIMRRIQLQKQQQKVVNNALQCFKKGQIINIDWRTKSNFRKSDAKVHLPRIYTEPLQMPKQSKIYKKSHRSSIFNSIFQNKNIQSTKNRSIQFKCQKLKELLFPKQMYQKSSKKDFFDNQPLQNEISLQRNSKLSLKNCFQSSQKSKKSSQKNIISSNKSINQISIRIQSRMDGTSQIPSNNVSRQNTNQDQLNFNFQKIRSNTQSIDLLKISLISNAKSQRDKSLKSNLQSSSQLQSGQKNQNQIVIKNQIQKKGSGRNDQNYDILSDPIIYSLISKSRDRLISFKQKISLKRMSQFQRFKYLQNKRNQNIDEFQSKKNKNGSFSIGGGDTSKISKSLHYKKNDQNDRKSTSKLQKISLNISLNDDKMQNSKVSERQKKLGYLFQKPQNIVDQSTERLWQQDQSKIKQKKLQSIVETQQKLMKKVKLSFLKQDLAKKFQQIRQFRKSPKSVI